jgi:regulator of nucleoside diphosphate kinase
MSLQENRKLRPEIFITDRRYSELNRLANASLRRTPHVAELLLSELERAEIVPNQALPGNIVDLGSWVTFKDDDSGEIQLVQIVYPHEVDITNGKISILTPVGAALLGLSEGQAIDCPTLDGRARRLRVLGVDRSRDRAR